MKSKLLLGLALVLGGVFSACSQSLEKPAASSHELPPGKLLETHVLKGRPAVAIYMRGFQDMAFNAYLKEGESEKQLFVSLPAMKSQFESTTHSIVRENHAKRISANRNGVGMYDVFWSKNSPRLAIAFMGNFIAGYDCKTGQKIQIRDGLDNKFQSQALGTVIESFLDGKDFTEAEVAGVRKHSYSESPHRTKP